MTCVRFIFNLGDIMNTIRLSIGDWSRDGHNQSEDVYIETNLTLDELKEAYDRGSEKLGFNLIEDYCAEYQDSTIPIYIADIIEAKLKISLRDEFNSMLDNIRILNTDQWRDIFLRTVWYARPNFEYKIIDPEDWMDIGGYGLFD